MKLLTLNTHSLVESDYQRKLCDFVQAVEKERPDIIALQEVNQSADGNKASENELTGYFACEENTVIRGDNHVMNAAKQLWRSGVKYNWTWLKIKKGYGKYEEGIALMSTGAIIEARVIGVSTIDDYCNWKTRKLLGVRTKNTGDNWFFSVHYGWWNDKEEPFDIQWKKTLANLPSSSKIWLMGDFNNPAQVRGEGYDMIKESMWYDCYEAALLKDDGITATKKIDGWKESMQACDSMRIDQIWHNKKTDISECKVIFNGKNYPVVSDHYGVWVECEE
ncbi:MAG: endonuclease/exonuclease/phosphatase family protein [Oscillospiraceae bacterium]|nr:endonuclease/exonuclease/phosphatase family protein [Oscillospiraceae bacterium]